MPDAAWPKTPEHLGLRHVTPNVVLGIRLPGQHLAIQARQCDRAELPELQRVEESLDVAQLQNARDDTGKVSVRILVAAGETQGPFVFRHGLDRLADGETHVGPVAGILEVVAVRDVEVAWGRPDRIINDGAGLVGDDDAAEPFGGNRTGEQHRLPKCGRKLSKAVVFQAFACGQDRKVERVDGAAQIMLQPQHEVPHLLLGLPALRVAGVVECKTDEAQYSRDQANADRQ